VVLDPKTKKVTHFVVSKGFLLKEHKVLPVEYIETSTQDRVTLKSSADDVDEFPDFEETHYVDLRRDDLDRSNDVNRYGPPAGMYSYPSVGLTGIWGPGYVTTLPYRFRRGGTYTEENIPDESVALDAGAKVVGEDGEKIGTLDSVLTEVQDGQATHLVVETGGLLDKTKKVVPVSWIDDIDEDEIRLSVKSNIVEKLREYQET
jgi:uncharacterized protein YrrD